MVYEQLKKLSLTLHTLKSVKGFEHITFTSLCVQMQTDGLY